MKFLNIRNFVMSTIMLVSALNAGSWLKESKDPNPLPKIPVVFHSSYDISFFGIEKLHPFDSKKYGNVYNFLVDELWTQENKSFTSPKAFISKSKIHAKFYTPEMVSDDDLLKVHTKQYLDSLNKSSVVAQIAEISPLSIAPNFLIRRLLLNPMKYATGGTILATNLALEQGWSINLSGGYHHAKAESGSGFCVYADIPLAIYKLHEKNPKLKVMIVDLDAHQGNGHEAVCGNDPRVAIYDIYNQNIYPGDFDAKLMITFDHPVRSFIKDKQYLELLKTTLPRDIDTFKPDLIIYNAGTDIYEKDALGRMSVSEEGIIKRDAFVFNIAEEKKIPIAMVLSGGYTKEGTNIICRSIKNILMQKHILNKPAPSPLKATAPITTSDTATAAA